MDADNQVAQKYGVMGFPTNVIIDRKGMIHLVEAGFNAESLGQTVANLLK